MVLGERNSDRADSAASVDGTSALSWAGSIDLGIMSGDQYGVDHASPKSTLRAVSQDHVTVCKYRLFFWPRSINRQNRRNDGIFL